jgi:hypothetical protein
LFCSYSSERSYAAGIIPGAGSDHAGTKNGKVGKQPAPQIAGRFQTSTPPPQQTPAGGYNLCS